LCAKKEQQTEMERSSKVDFFAAMSKLWFREKVNLNVTRLRRSSQIDMFIRRK
jgi:hypothetical protein